MATLTIQIINYKTKQYLISCIKDLLKDLKHSKIEYKINILDNGSGDNLSDLEKLYKDNKHISFHYSRRNLRFATGHNLLAKKASGKYLLLVNPDIKLIEKNTVVRLLEIIQKDKSTKVVGPKLLNSDKTPQAWDHGELKGFLPNLVNKFGLSYWKNQQSATAVAWVSGAFFLVEIKLFKSLGGFDENFFLYSEELDLCLRARTVGYKVVYNPSVRVVHHGSVTTSKPKYLPESQLYYIKKHYSNKWHYPLVKTFLTIRNKLFADTLWE